MQLTPFPCIHPTSHPNSHGLTITRPEQPDPNRQCTTPPSAVAVPLPVACKEAVDLSVAYGGMSDSHRYVNGVLGAYAREYL